MALSEKRVLDRAWGLLWRPQYTGLNPVALPRAVEAEVRKDDEALIRQLVEALEGSIAITMVKIDQRNAAIAAARARLGGKA